MKYIATAVVTLSAGAEVGLTKDQAAARRHCTAQIDDRKGWYLVTAPLQFKVGESFLYDAEIPKALADAVELVKRGPSKAEQEAKAKAEQEAKAKAEGLDVARAAVVAAEAAIDQAGSDDTALAAAGETLSQARAALAALEG